MTARVALFAVSLLLAATAPLLPRTRPDASEAAGFPGWPARFDGQPLQSMVAAPEDAYFTRGFPGKVARFASGNRQVVVRWVNSATRRLHPARHCFAGAGYEIHPQPMAHDANGELMSCFSARKAGNALRVCEVLRGTGTESWPDVSSWYWHALSAPAGKSWWSFVIVERQADPIGL